jgi:hypothetical protein
MRWLGKLFGNNVGESANGADSNALLEALNGYPPYSPPHLGWGKSLSNEQADDNLHYLTENLPVRLNHIGALLADFDVETAPLLDSGAYPLEAAALIDDWLTRALPPRDALLQDRPPNPPRDMFIESDRTGSAILFSFVTDLGLLEAEALRIRHSGFDWGLPRSRGQRGRMEYNRPCLIKPNKTDWDAQIIDHELWMLECLYAKRNGIAIHPFGYQLQTMLCGGFDPAPIAR